MSHSATVSPTSAQPLAGTARELLRWVTCHNPFYALSAALFLVGLRISFQAQAGELDTWTLMGGLAAYTLLLALTAFVLVRYAKDWEDLRTVLLLVVLMFLATSVTFDEVLTVSPGRGFACYLGGLAFTILVSEGVLHGIRLKLGVWFRVPYYLILSVFFLYPLALTPFADQPHSEALLWGLFGFSAVAGLVFLALLPAIRRGPQYVQGNGSPWSWPVYPWVLFGLLALAVPARAILLCWSMHRLPAGQYEQLMFGPYFVIPFGLAVIVLLMEIGLVARRRKVMWIALAAPLALVGLALLGHRDDAIYKEFLELFTARLGGNPLYLTVLASAGFYAYAALRRVPLATESLTVVLVALAFVGRDKVGLSAGDPMVSVATLLTAALLQLLLGWWRRDAWRCLAAAEGLVAVTAFWLPSAFVTTTLGHALLFHLGLLGVLAVGAAFRDKVGRFLQGVGAALVLFACLSTAFGPLDNLEEVPAGAVAIYPLVMAAFLAGYGKLLGHRGSCAVALGIAGYFLARMAWLVYLGVRQAIVGIDQIVLSMALFVLALLISLGKAGLLGRWLIAWGWKRPALEAPNESNPGGNLE